MPKKLIFTVPDNYDFAHIDLPGILRSGLAFEVEELPSNGRKNKKAHRPGNISRRHADQTVEQTLMAPFTPLATFSQETAEKWVTSKGYSANSAAPRLHKLVKSGFLSRQGNLFRYEKPLQTAKSPIQVKR